MARFRDIQELPAAHYAIDVPWTYLDDTLKHWSTYNLNLEPDFQRAHIWTVDQQERYVEWILQGGESGCDLYFNHPKWDRMAIDDGDEMVLVDGKQRLQAVQDFLAGKVRAFGHLFPDYTDKPDILTARFKFHVACLPTRFEVLNWYLKINAGGTPHTKQELDRVRALLEQERK